MKPKILTTLQDYSLAELLRDSVAGLTVAMVAIPLSLAIAIASGAPPEKGLVTAIVGGFLISLLGGSRVQIGGPTGAFIVIVFSVIAEHGYDGLVLATFMAGVILVIAGYLRLGKLIALVPEAVVNGFTLGIALVIAFSQLRDLMGLDMASQPAEFIARIEALWSARETLSGLSLAIGGTTLALIFGLRRLWPAFPGLIVAVIAGSLLAMWAGPSVETIGSRFGDIPSVFALPGWPAVTPERIVELLPSAFIIAFLAGVESLLSAMVADRMIGGKHRPTAEIAAQGFANIGSAIAGGMPATGAIARTATNVRAGGRTPVAGVIHALVILIVMALAAPLVAYLAMPAMAAVLLATAWNMSEPHKWRGYVTGPRSDTVLLVLTLVLTVLVDLTVAIGVGVSLGLAIRLSRRGVPPSSWRTPRR
ncbi:SulP family inorganic anion transporter [Hyphobacterium marinum]|uniref:SulP family inorganic anion transporter n=1 Tax=Hyphobacterium marinum TaxID=3116574 RepID=A0ABU7LXV9_9PROT|nr:SulP family inorganic anion transporter [Hyphobacterium sp. Y6023]MEE2566392.1 SulP family inorganic anion transporter [Hyphobacterium sp. Y6023]